MSSGNLSLVIQESFSDSFELVLESLGTIPLTTDLGQFRVIFFLILEIVYFMYSLESPQVKGNQKRYPYYASLKLKLKV